MQKSEDSSKTDANMIEDVKNSGLTCKELSAKYGIGLATIYKLKYANNIQNNTNVKDNKSDTSYSLSS